MHKTWIVGLSIGLGAGCFSPNEAITVDTRGSGGDTDTGASTGAGETTDGPNSTESSASTADPTDTSTDDPTENPSTTIDPTEGDTDTGVGDPCAGPEDCASGVCVGMECVPCGDAGDPDAACAEADSATPVCGEDGLSCVACTANSCDGSAPACDPAVGCVACNEHSQCPDSACHLGGPDEGSCFDTADVVEVSDTSELVDAMSGVSSGTQLVLHMLAGAYDGAPTVSVPDGTEVALIGSPGTTVSGGFTSLINQAGGFLYVDRVDFDTGPGRAFTINGGGQTWLNRVSVENYSTAVQVFDGTLRVQNSMFRGAVVFISAGSSLVAINSDFGPQGDPAIETAGTIDLRYVTIAGNDSGLNCLAGADGVVRNSILVNPGTSVSGTCTNDVDLIDNASDTFGVGEDVGPYDSGWFVISTGSRFFRFS